MYFPFNCSIDNVINTITRICIEDVSCDAKWLFAFWNCSSCIQLRLFFYVQFLITYLGQLLVKNQFLKVSVKRPL